MKISSLFGNRTNAIKKFPVSHVLLLILTVLVVLDIYGVDFSYLEECTVAVLFSLLLSFYGPIFSLHSSQVLIDTRKKNIINVGLQVVALILGGLYCFILISAQPRFHSEYVLYYGIIPLVKLGIFLLIAWMTRKNGSKTRFSWTNFIVAIFFGSLAGGIVWGGLSGALGSIEMLFDVDLPWRFYKYFGAVCMILLAGSFMLNYYLFEITSLDVNVTVAPSRMRKIFGSYIFLSLAFIYLAIFFAYAVKILVTGVWPKGVIVYLGLGYFSLGMVCYYLTYPEQGKFYDIIRKILFVSFILMTFMMISAINQRINQHGFTENRYYVCMGIGVIIVFSFTALIFPKKTWLLFVSLSVLAGLIGIYGGPISAEHVAYNSQVNRLSNLLEDSSFQLPLEKNGFSGLSGDNLDSIRDTMHYLANKGEGTGWMVGIITGYSPDTYFYGYNLTDSYLGYEYHYSKPTASKESYFSWSMYTAGSLAGIDISGYSKIYDIDPTYGMAYTIGDENTFQVTVEKEIVSVDISGYADMFADAVSSNQDTSHPFVFEQKGRTYMITALDGYRNNETGKVRISGVRGYVLVK